MVKEETQQKYMELQHLNQQVKQSQDQLEALQQQIIELTSVNQNLDEFKKVKIDKDILVQINNGIFAKASIKDNKNLIVNIGSEVAVKKDIPSTKKLIQEQIDEIKKLQQKKLVELQDVVLRINILEKEIAEALEKKE